MALAARANETSPPIRRDAQDVDGQRHAQSTSNAALFCLLKEVCLVLSRSNRHQTILILSQLPTGLLLPNTPASMRALGVDIALGSEERARHQLVAFWHRRLNRELLKGQVVAASVGPVCNSQAYKEKANARRRKAQGAERKAQGARPWRTHPNHLRSCTFVASD